MTNFEIYFYRRTKRLLKNVILRFKLIFTPADYLTLSSSKLTIIKIYLINFPAQSSREVRLGRKNVILYFILIFWPLLVHVMAVPL